MRWSFGFGMKSTRLRAYVESLYFYVLCSCLVFRRRVTEIHYTNGMCHGNVFVIFGPTADATNAHKGDVMSHTTARDAFVIRCCTSSIRV